MRMELFGSYDIMSITFVNSPLVWLKESIFALYLETILWHTIHSCYIASRSTDNIKNIVMVVVVRQWSLCSSHSFSKRSIL